MQLKTPLCWDVLIDKCEKYVVIMTVMDIIISIGLKYKE